MGVGNRVYKAVDPSKLFNRENSRMATPPPPLLANAHSSFGYSSFPKYEDCLSSVSCDELPNIRTTKTIPTIPITLEVGPGIGFFECLDEVANRKKVLKGLLKLVTQNPEALREPECELAKFNLGLEDIKRKLLNLKLVERDVKRFSILLHSKRRQLHSDPQVHGKSMDTYAFDVVQGQKVGQPNADSYYAERFQRMIVLGVADGIGWGEPSRRAAQAALLGFGLKIKDRLLKKSDS